MRTVSARLARGIGYDSFSDLTDVPVTSIAGQPDGACRVTFADDLPPETVLAVWQRMAVADAAAQSARDHLAGLRDALATDPSLEARDALLLALTDHLLER